MARHLLDMLAVFSIQQITWLYYYTCSTVLYYSYINPYQQ